MRSPKAGGYARTIASNMSDMGSVKTAKQSVLSNQTNGLMFKCFDSIYGGRRLLTAVKDHRSSMGSQTSSRFGQGNSALKGSFGGTPQRLDNHLNFAIQNTSPGNGFPKSFNPPSALQFMLGDQNEIPEEDLDDTCVKNDSDEEGGAQSLSPKKEHKLLKQDEVQNLSRRNTIVHKPLAAASQHPQPPAQETTHFNTEVKKPSNKAKEQATESLKSKKGLLRFFF